MNYSVLTTKEWQERLENKILFASDLRGKLESIAAIEIASISKFEDTYVGHSRLADSAIVFFVHTLEEAPKLLSRSKKPNHLMALVLIDLLMMLRKLRCSTILGGLGYPGPAFSLLRDIKDKAILLSAVFQGSADYADLSGVDSTIATEATRSERRNRSRSARKRAEKQVFDRALRFNDFSDPEMRENLEIWQGLFDRENHGSSISAAAATKTFVMQQKPLFLVSNDDIAMTATHINRFCEVAWLFLRLLPNLQSRTIQFDHTWQDRWQVLDQSFWQTQQEMVLIGKNIGKAITAFVESRFPYDAKSHYPQ